MVSVGAIVARSPAAAALSRSICAIAAVVQLPSAVQMRMRAPSGVTSELSGAAPLEQLPADGALLVVTLTVAVDRLPDVSVARAMTVCAPSGRPAVAHDHDHDVVPVAGCHAPPSTSTSTEARPTLSAAPPWTLTVPLTVEPAAGAAMLTVGGVASGAALLTFTATTVVAVWPGPSV